MNILITGSKGQLGLEISSRLFERKDASVFLTDEAELDITDIESVIKTVKKIKPSIIINCAAYTAVDKCETDVDIAYKVNAIGPRNLAIASLETKARLVHISTDYVFDGEGIKDAAGNNRPYIEFDEPNPQTVYGKTKLEGERFVRSITPYHFILRTAWLYGEGNNFVRTMLKLAKENDAVNVVNDQYGSPTSTRELARTILAVMDTDNYGVFHATCEGQCTWYEFTQEIFRLKGIKTKIQPVTSEEFPRPAKRPKYSVLDNYMFRLTTKHWLNNWKDEIKTYLKRA
jgi:dTDP-4-dehydrorhamnose reductase